MNRFVTEEKYIEGLEENVERLSARVEDLLEALKLTQKALKKVAWHAVPTSDFGWDSRTISYCADRDCGASLAQEHVGECDVHNAIVAMKELI